MNGERCASFAARLRAGEPLIGTFVKTPSPIVSEVLASTALDALCFDTEHAPFGRVDLDLCLAMSRAADMPSVVRVASAEHTHVLNALDCGASGVLVPHVVSAEAAQAVAKSCHYGRGGRGYAGSSRAAEYGGKALTDHLRDSADQTAVIAQVEDVEALEDIDAMAQVSGIDCLFVGRIDLTVALGAATPNDAVVVKAVDEICAAGKRHGRAIGMFVADPAEASVWREKGASLFLLSSDHSFLKAGARELAARFRAG